MRSACSEARQLLAEPSHGAVEMMEIEPLDAVDAVIVTPVLAGTVGARHHQSMQDGQKDGALDRELETPSPKKLLDNGPAAGLAPQPIKQQRSADALAVEIRCAPIVKNGEHHGSLGETRSGAGEAIEITTGLDHLLAAEVLDDALLGRAVLAHALDQVNVAVGADSLLAEEHKYSICKLNDKSSKFVTKPALFSITNFFKLDAPKINTRQINELRERRVTKNENGVEEGPCR